MIDWKPSTSNNIIDLLHARPSRETFEKRIDGLRLSRELNEKIQLHLNQGIPSLSIPPPAAHLSETDEKELALEVLLTRHRFTELILGRKNFRQAALTVIQNIYLFRNRKIFFGSDFPTTEIERQEALVLLSKPGTRISLARTFQHLIIARVWNRITSCGPDLSLQTGAFDALHDQVEKLNTLRNIYMLMSAGLVHSVVSKTSRIYRQSLPYEDAVQVGCFGIARAAYRYHPSCGIRFSTYAANWIRKEIQRQALACRLVRISSNIVEKYAEALKKEDSQSIEKLSTVIGDTPALSSIQRYRSASVPEQTQDLNPADITEKKQTALLLHHLIDTVLSMKSGDVIKRRFGLPPYSMEQSIIRISSDYGVSRSSIYQLEQRALKTLAGHLQQHALTTA